MVCEVFDDRCLDIPTYFMYLFGILMSMLARIMFGSNLLRSFIAYFSLGSTAKGEQHVMASFLGTFFFFLCLIRFYVENLDDLVSGFLSYWLYYSFHFESYLDDFSCTGVLNVPHCLEYIIIFSN